ncbi:MAG: glycosyl hydrolase [Alphaproteobacteria bacterium]|nr:glycosyl hydrolase [Alphaproteobacteria bacterium]
MRTTRLALFAVTAALALAQTEAFAGDVQVWLTTPDAIKRLSREPGIAFDGGLPAAIITIDADTRYQEIVGFGAALTDASAWLIQNKMSESQRAALLKELFGRDGGLGLSFTRLTIGASDFSLRDYSFDDQPKGARDPDLRHFSIEPNRADVLPLVKRALAINPQLKIMASPWSAPGWMKSSDSLIQGSLLPEAFPAYAEYFRRYIDAYAAEGVAIYAITIQNEPHFEPADYPGMRVTPPMRAAFIGSYLGPLLSRTHPEVRIWDWDHNWDEPQSPLTVLADPNASRYVAGVAWHCYAGEPSAQGPVHDAHPDKETWLTECSGGEWSQWKDALPWMAGTLVRTTRQWSKGVLFWNLALDENHGPHTGGCTDCRGVVTIDSRTGDVTRNLEYYILGHASRFVVPGAVRVDSGAEITGIDDVAFRNPDGSIVLIAVNRQSEPRAFGVRQKNQSFEYVLAPGSVATFVWR